MIDAVYSKFPDFMLETAGRGVGARAFDGRFLCKYSSLVIQSLVLLPISQIYLVLCPFLLIDGSSTNNETVYLRALFLVPLMRASLAS
jgi:hypothetical protein